MYIYYDKRLAKNVQPYGLKICYVLKRNNDVIIFLVNYFRKKKHKLLVYVTPHKNCSTH